MRGPDIPRESLLTTATLANSVPDAHPLHEIRALVDEALNSLFSTPYPETGRASIAPEKLLRAQLLQLFYSIRSERFLMEPLQYNLLFRWFVGIAIDEAVWEHSLFSNRNRLNRNEAAAQFLREVVVLAQKRNPMSHEHFSVDGTLRQAWASHKTACQVRFRLQLRVQPAARIACLCEFARHGAQAETIDRCGCDDAAHIALLRPKTGFQRLRRWRVDARRPKENPGAWGAGVSGYGYRCRLI